MLDSLDLTLEDVLQVAFDALLAVNPEPKGIEVSAAMLQALVGSGETLCSIWHVPSGYGLSLAGHIDPLWIHRG